MKENGMTTTADALNDEALAELQAHRDGIGQLAEDPMHAGQPINVTYGYVGDEPTYRLQVTHGGIPVWQCDRCRKLTVTSSPSVCAGCGLNAVEAFTPLLYPESVVCRSWLNRRSGQLAPVDGPCLIAGSDGCECADGEL